MVGKGRQQEKWVYSPGEAKRAVKKSLYWCVFTKYARIANYPRVIRDKASRSRVIHVILICEQSSVFTCMSSRKGSILTSWLLLITIISSSYTTTYNNYNTDYRSTKINSCLVLLGIRENFPVKMLDKDNS